MKVYYVQVEDCQNNVEAIVKVHARSNEDAKYRALRALHAENNLYIVSKEDAMCACENEGINPIDEHGDEVDLEED